MTDQEKPRSADYKLGYSSGYVAGQKSKSPEKLEGKIKALCEEIDRLKVARGDYFKDISAAKERNQILHENLDTVLDAVWRTLPMYVRDTLLLQFPDPVYACVERLRTKDIEESEQS